MPDHICCFRERVLKLVAIIFIATPSAYAQSAPRAQSKVDTIRFRKEWHITSDASPVGDSLGILSSIIVDARGRTYVTDFANSKIWTFDANGRSSGSIGRDGKGPGEFDKPSGLGIAPDGRLVVRDITRYSFFSPNATSGILSRYSGGFRRAAMADYTNTRPSKFDNSGALFDVSFNSIDRKGLTYGRYYRYSASGVLQDSIVVNAFADAPIGTAYYRTGKGGGRMLRGLDYVPFAAIPAWDVTTRGTLLVARGDKYEIEERDAAGKLLRTFRRDELPISIPIRVRADSLAALRARLDSIPVPLDQVIGLIASVRRSELPRVFPPFIAVYAMDDGSVWVRRWNTTATAQTLFDVFSADGKFISVVVLPHLLALEPTPSLSLGRIVGIAVDEDSGANTVISFRRN